MRTDVVGCFSKLLEAAYSAGGSAAARSAGGAGGRGGRGRGGEGGVHQYYHPHTREGPKGMVREDFFEC